MNVSATGRTWAGDRSHIAALGTVADAHGRRLAYLNAAPNGPRRVSVLVRPRHPRVRADADPTWTGTVTTGTEVFSGTPHQSPWLWELLGARAQRGRSSIAFEGIASRRFDQSDAAVAVESYVGLASSNYAYLRAQYTPSAHTLPTADVTGEFFQTFAKEFEASLNLRRMTYAQTGTTTGSLGLAWTHGDNYLRGRYIALVQSGGGLVSAFLLTERRYGKDADTYAEGGASVGQRSRERRARSVLRHPRQQLRVPARSTIRHTAPWDRRAGLRDTAGGHSHAHGFLSERHAALVRFGRANPRRSILPQPFSPRRKLTSPRTRQTTVR